jgi:hypothetical protein
VIDPAAVLPGVFTAAEALTWMGALADALDAARREGRAAGELTLGPAGEADSYIRVSDELARTIAGNLRAASRALTPAAPAPAPVSAATGN